MEELDLYSNQTEIVNYIGKESGMTYDVEWTCPGTLCEGLDVN